MTHYPNEQILVEASIINKPAKAWEKASVHRLAVGSFRASKRSMLTARGLYPGVVVVVVGGGGMGLITKLKRRIETSYCSYMAVLIKMRFEFTPFFNLQNVVKKKTKSSQYKLGGLQLNILFSVYRVDWPITWRGGWLKSGSLPHMSIWYKYI